MRTTCNTPNLWGLNSSEGKPPALGKMGFPLANGQKGLAVTTPSWSYGTARSMSPVMYLDVDGPLNPWRSKGPHKHWPDYRKHSVTVPDGRTFRMWFSPSLGDALLSLVDRHQIEVVWATSWVDHVDSLIVPLAGLQAGWRTIPYPDSAADELRNTGKVSEVAADAGDQPVIWIDDELGVKDRAWAMNRVAPTLLVRPGASVGLRRQDLDSIDVWCQGAPVWHQGPDGSVGWSTATSRGDDPAADDS